LHDIASEAVDVTQIEHIQATRFLLHCGSMSAPPQRRWNGDPLWGFLLALTALAVNAGFFVPTAVQAALPWVSLLLAVTALVFVIRGLRRALVQSRIYRRKALSIVLGVVTLVLAGLSIVAFYGARLLPGAAIAPQVGQTAPDFTLADTHGRPVSLDSLFAAADSSTPAPKAVLLIFYRGYW